MPLFYELYNTDYDEILRKSIELYKYSGENITLEFIGISYDGKELFAIITGDYTNSILYTPNKEKNVNPLVLIMYAEMISKYHDSGYRHVIIPFLPERDKSSILREIYTKYNIFAHFDLANTLIL